MNTENYELLSIWDVNAYGHSIPLSYAQFADRIQRLEPSAIAADYYDRWHSEALMEATVHREFILTMKGLVKRKALPTLRIVPKAPVITKSGEVAWARFRRLLSYYIDCVTHQEKSQQNLYSDKEGKEFFLPAMPHGWLPPLSDEASKSHEINITISSREYVAFSNIICRQEDDEPIYIGYPIAMYRTKKKTLAYSPIGLIPVEIIKHSKTTLSLRLLLDEVEINQTWLEYQFSQGAESQETQVKSFMRQIHALHNKEDDPCRGCIDLHAALPFIQAHAKMSDGHELKPNNHHLSLNASLMADEKSILYNAPLLFVGQDLLYSKTLRKELRYLRDRVKAEVLDQTALAYVFRDPPLQQERQGEREFAYPFISSNEEQSIAVEEAINEPLSRITGPPGTGKSQVAVNIIANLLYRGKSVLFTSKNHKAIHAIEQRSATMLGASDMHFMNFCAADDGSVTNLWHNQDLELIISKALHAHQRKDSSRAKRVHSAAQTYADIEQAYAGRKECLERVSTLNEQLELHLEELHRILALDNEDATIWHKNHLRQMKRLRKELRDDVHFSWKPKSLIQWILWSFRYKKLSQQADAELKKLFPQMTAFVYHRELLRQKLKEAETELAGYLKCFPECQQAETDASEQRCVSDALASIKKYQDEMSENLQAALIYRRSESIVKLSKDAEAKQKLIGCMQLLKKLYKPADLNRKDAQEAASEGFGYFKKFCPAWAPTLLSLSRSSPCLPALFDKVIIDEASQCEIAPMIPALFRAKTVTVIGDPAQFPPVITMSNHDYWERKYQLDPMREHQFNYKTSTCFNVIAAAPVFLKEHFRCHPDIAAYFNAEFYGNKLIVRSDTEKLAAKMPKALGFEHALEWIDVRNSQEGEYQAAAELMQKLVDSRYEGSVGVITPFRASAHDLNELLLPITKKLVQPDVRISTVNAYQGGERDLIIFVLAYSSDLIRGKKWYLCDPANRYIFNVAISRARACLVVVGDRAACKASGAKALNSLANYPKGRDSQLAGAFESIWEERLYEALLAEGIQTTPQRPLSGRRLDLALEYGDLKLDIEVDGVAYHTNRHGERNTSDIFRDAQLESLGWQVQRFWVYELKKNMPACLAKVKAYMEKAGAHPQPLSISEQINLKEALGEEAQQRSSQDLDKQNPFPDNQGYKAGYHWLDSGDPLEDVKNHLATLVGNRYAGSVAIVTPLAETARFLKKELSPIFRKLSNKNKQICSIAKYEGDRSDLMILVLDYQTASKSEKWYQSQEHLLNRIVLGKARAGILLVGHRASCKSSGIETLVKLASKSRQARKAKAQFDSVWEKNFYEALTAAGLKPIPQYAVAGRRLDFALIVGDNQLDIEVDGSAFHRTDKGARKDSDVFRDAIMEAFAWRVLRFRVDELENNMPRCVQRVKKSIQR